MTLFKTAAGSLALKITGSALGMANAILLARILGPAEFGVYSIFIAAATLFATLAVLGLPSLITREVAIHIVNEKWPLLKGLLFTSHQWVIAVSLLLVLAGALFYPWITHSYHIPFYGMLMILLLIPLLALNQLRAAVLRGFHWVVLADMPDLLIRPMAVFGMLVIIYILSKSAAVSTVILVQLVAAILALVFGSIFLANRLPQAVRRTKMSFAKRHWFQHSGIFLGITILGLLENQISLYLLGIISGAKHAGLFQAANQVVSVVVMGLVALNLPLQPKLAAEWSQGNVNKAQNYITEVTRIGAGGAIFAAIILFPLASTVMKLFGSQFESAAVVVRILLLGQMLNALAGPCGVVLAMTGHQHFVVYGLLSALSVNLIMAFVLIPQFGIAGAAWANTISIFIWNALLAIFVWKKTRLVTILK